MSNANIHGVVFKRSWNHIGVHDLQTVALLPSKECEWASMFMNSHLRRCVQTIVQMMCEVIGRFTHGPVADFAEVACPMAELGLHAASPHPCSITAAYLRRPRAFVKRERTRDDVSVRWRGGGVQEVFEVTGDRWSGVAVDLAIGSGARDGVSVSGGACGQNAGDLLGVRLGVASARGTR
jgi:hypothetical protein